MNNITERLLLLEEEVSDILKRAEKNAARLIADAEEKSSELLLQSNRKAKKERDALFSVIAGDLKKLQEKRKALEKIESEKLRKHFEPETVSDRILRRIEKKLCDEKNEGNAWARSYPDL